MRTLFLALSIFLVFGAVGCTSEDKDSTVPVVDANDPAAAPPGIKASSVGAAGGPAGGATQKPATD